MLTPPKLIKELLLPINKVNRVVLVISKLLNVFIYEVLE